MSVLIQVFPSNEPRSKNLSLQGSQCYLSGDTINFSIPPSAQVLQKSIFSCSVAWVDNTFNMFAAADQNNILTAPGVAKTSMGSAMQNIIDFNASLGCMALFDTMQFKIYLTANVVESCPTWPLVTNFITRSRLGGNFVDYSVGTNLYPMFSDVSIDIGCRLGGNSFRTVCITLPFGLLNSGYPLDLEKSGGLSIDLVMSTFQRLGNCTHILANLTYLPSTNAAITAPLANFSPYQVVPSLTYNFDNSPSLLTLDSATNVFNYNLVIAKPVLWVITIAKQNGVEGPSLIPFTYLAIKQNQTLLGINQFMGLSFTSEMIRSFNFLLYNKLNYSNSAVGYVTSQAFQCSDLLFYRDGQKQIYGYLTAGTPLPIQWSTAAPNAFIQVANVNSFVADLFVKVWKGSFQSFYFDIGGNGVSFANTLVQYQLYFKPFNRPGPSTQNSNLNVNPYLSYSDLPYNTVNSAYTPWNWNVSTISIPGIYPSTVNGPEIQQMSSTEPYMANQFLTGGFTEYEQNPTGTRTPPALTVYCNLSPDLTLTSSHMKYIQPLDPQQNSNVITATEQVRSVELSTTSGSTLNIAPNATKLPKYLKLNYAAPQSNVVRVQELFINCSVVTSETPNSITLEALLPAAGFPGKMFLFFRPIWVNDQPIPQGFGMYILPTTTFTPAGITRIYQILAFGTLLLTADITTTNPNIAGGGAAANSVFLNQHVVTTNNTVIDTQNPQATNNFYTAQPVTNCVKNTIGYSAILGAASFIRGVQWLLPMNLKAAFPFVQEDLFNLTYGLPSANLSIQDKWEKSFTDSWIYDPSYNHQLVDSIPNRTRDTCFPSWLSCFPFHETTVGLSGIQLSDFQISQAPNFIPILRLPLYGVHPSFVSMREVPYTAEYNRRLRIVLDTRCIAFANVPGGVNRGVTTEMNLVKYLHGPRITNASTPQYPSSRLTTVTGAIQIANSNLFQAGFQRTVPIGWILDPTYVPVLWIETVFFDESTMLRQVNEFATRGVDMSFVNFDYQRRYMQNDIIASVNLFDQITADQQFFIGSRGISQLLLTHRHLLNVNGDLVVSQNPAANEAAWQTPVHCGAGGATMPCYLERLAVPWYVASRLGCLTYSVPFGVENPGTVVKNNVTQLPEYKVLVDNSLVFPFSVGDNVTNQIMYAMGSYLPLRRPDQEVNYNAKRILKMYSTGLPRIFSQYDSTQAYATPINTGDGIAAGNMVQATTLYWPPPISGVNDNITWGASLLPFKNVVPIVIPPDFQNGQILKIPNITSQTYPFHNYITGYPAQPPSLFTVFTTPIVPYITQALSPVNLCKQVGNAYYANYYSYSSNLVGAQDTTNYAFTSNWNLLAFANCQQLCRTIAFMQVMKIHFNNTVANLAILFPSGAVLEA